MRTAEVFLVSLFAFMGANAVKIWDLEYYEQLQRVKINVKPFEGCVNNNGASPFFEFVENTQGIQQAIDDFAAQQCTVGVSFEIGFYDSPRKRFVDPVPVRFSPTTGAPVLLVKSFVLNVSRIKELYPDIDNIVKLDPLTLQSVTFELSPVAPCQKVTLQKVTPGKPFNQTLTSGDLTFVTNERVIHEFKFSENPPLLDGGNVHQFVLIPDNKTRLCNADPMEVKNNMLTAIISTNVTFKNKKVNNTLHRPQALPNLNGWKISELKMTDCSNASRPSNASHYKDLLLKSRESCPSSSFILKLTNTASFGFQPVKIQGEAVNHTAPAFFLGSYAPYEYPVSEDNNESFISQGIGTSRLQLTGIDLQNITATPNLTECGQVEVLARSVPYPFVPAETLVASDFTSLGITSITNTINLTTNPMVLDPGSVLNVALRPTSLTVCTFDDLAASSVSFELTSEKPTTLPMADKAAMWESKLSSNLSLCRNADNLVTLKQCAISLQPHEGYVLTNRLISKDRLYPYPSEKSFKRSASVFLSASQLEDIRTLMSITFEGARFVPFECNKNVKIKANAVDIPLNKTDTSEKSVRFKFSNHQLEKKDTSISFIPTGASCQIWGSARIEIELSKIEKGQTPIETKIDLSGYKNSWIPAYQIMTNELCKKDKCTSETLHSQVALLDCLNKIRARDGCGVQVSNNVTSNIKNMMGFQQGSNRLPSMIFGAYKDGGSEVLDRVVVNHEFGKVTQQLQFFLSSVKFESKFAKSDCNEYRVGVMAELQNLDPFHQLEEAEVPNKQTTQNLPADYTFNPPGLALEHNRRQLMLLPQKRGSCFIETYNPSAIFKTVEAKTTIFQNGLMPNSTEVNWIWAGYRLRDRRFCAPLRAECKVLIRDQNLLENCVEQARLINCTMSVSMFINSSSILFGEQENGHLIPAVNLNNSKFVNNIPITESGHGIHTSPRPIKGEKPLTFDNLRSINFGNTFYRHLCNHVTLSEKNWSTYFTRKNTQENGSPYVFSTETYHSFLPEIRFSASDAPIIKDGRIRAFPVTKIPNCLWTGGKVTLELNTGPRTWNIPDLSPLDALTLTKIRAQKPDVYRIAPGVCETPVVGACYQTDFANLSGVEDCLNKMKASKCSATVVATLKIPMSLSGISYVTVPTTVPTTVPAKKPATKPATVPTTVPALPIPNPEPVLGQRFNLIGVDFSGHYETNHSCNNAKLFKLLRNISGNKVILASQVAELGKSPFVLPVATWSEPMEVPTDLIILAVPEDHPNQKCSWPVMGMIMPTVLYSTKEIAL